MFSRSFSDLRDASSAFMSHCMKFAGLTHYVLAKTYYTSLWATSGYTKPTHRKHVLRLMTMSAANVTSTTSVASETTTTITSSLLYTEITPGKLLTTYPGKFYRLTVSNETHHGLTYKTGLNVDPLPFDPTSSCSSGGMYFLHESQLKYYQEVCAAPWSMRWLREVTFPPNARIYVEEKKFKADKFILGEREVIPDWVYEECLAHDAKNIAYIPARLKTPEVCSKTVKRNPAILQFVPDTLRTKEMCREAVEQNGILLQFVPIHLRTAEMCLKAVKTYGLALQSVPDSLKTEEMCREAVKNHGLALKYVPHDIKTAEMCLDAVTMDWYAMNYVPTELHQELKTLSQNRDYEARSWR